MSCLSISCRLADALFSVDESGAPGPVSPDAGLTLAFFGLPLGEVEFEVIPFVPSPAGRVASNGELLVAFVWADGRRYEVSTDA